MKSISYISYPQYVSTFKLKKKMIKLRNAWLFITNKDLFDKS
jgi:hypothetical protein